MRRPGPGGRPHHYADDVRRAIERATSLTTSFNHEHLGSEHLLAALLREDSVAAAALLRELGHDPRQIMARLVAQLAPGTGIVTGARLMRSACFTRALACAEPIADECGHPQVDTRHVLIGLAAGEGLAAEVLRQAGVSVEALRARLGALPQTRHSRGEQAPAGNGAGPAC
jgi:ATP-dependent Clp protease ATP-binding subunit ClpA